MTQFPRREESRSSIIRRISAATLSPTSLRWFDQLRNSRSSSTETSAIVNPIQSDVVPAAESAVATTSQISPLSETSRLDSVSMFRGSDGILRSRSQAASRETQTATPAHAIRRSQSGTNSVESVHTESGATATTRSPIQGGAGHERIRMYATTGHDESTMEEDSEEDQDSDLIEDEDDDEAAEEYSSTNEEDEVLESDDDQEEDAISMEIEQDRYSSRLDQATSEPTEAVPIIMHRNQDSIGPRYGTHRLDVTQFRTTLDSSEQNDYVDAQEATASSVAMGMPQELESDSGEMYEKMTKLIAVCPVTGDRFDFNSLRTVFLA